jgi:hypothetical protein
MHWLWEYTTNWNSGSSSSVQGGGKRRLMVSHGKGPTPSEKMGSNKTRGGSSSVPPTVRGNSTRKLCESGASLVTVELQAGSTATHRVSQPSRSKIRLRRPRRGRGRAAPVGFDDLDGRVWVSFGVANACYGYTGVCQGGGDRGEVKAGGKGGPVGGCRCCARSRVCERPWVVK